MTKKQSTLERLVSLLQGASWALALLGAFYSFTLLYPISLFMALVGAFLGAIPGFIFVVLFEMAHLQFDKLNELKKQTTLMQEILETSKNDNPISDN